MSFAESSPIQWLHKWSCADTNGLGVIGHRRTHSVNSLSDGVAVERVEGMQKNRNPEASTVDADTLFENLHADVFALPEEENMPPLQVELLTGAISRPLLVISLDGHIRELSVLEAVDLSMALMRAARKLLVAQSEEPSEHAKQLRQV